VGVACGYQGGVEKAQLRVRGNGNKFRFLPLAPETVQLLEHYLRLERPDPCSAALFVSLKGRMRGVACHQMLRAVVFWANLQHELGGGGDTSISVNAASPQLAFIPFQYKGLNIGL